MTRFIPWYLKIGAKIVLSRLPFSYRLWAGMGLFKLGKMADPDYALKIFFIHYDRLLPQRGKVFLETGPGDSVASALCAHAVGAEKIYLLDVGDFATRDMDFYRRVAGALQAQGLTPPEITEEMTFEELLAACNAEYLTGGLKSLAQIPDQSVDYAWSHSVMEHVRKSEFFDTITHHYRILKPGGIISHSIDLQDHLGGKLNNLRFSEKLWESDFMASSGFYTNRLRASEIVNLFARAGFIIANKQTGQWGAIPTPRNRLAAPYDQCAEADLLTRTLAVKLEKPTNQQA